MISEDLKADLLFDLPKDMRGLAKKLISRLERGDLEVPLLPAVATEVMRLANDPESDARAISDLIQSDLSLAGHVMHVANSAMYSPTTSIVSLQQAVARLGIKLISEIALGVALNSKLFNAPGYEERLVAISEHAFCTALWSREVARLAHETVEASFLCGLLHSIGRAGLLQELANIRDGMEWPEETEDAILHESILHSIFGEHICRTWEMPEIVTTTVRFSERFDECEKYNINAIVVHISAKLARKCLNREPLEELASDPCFAMLNIYQDQVFDLMEKADQVTATAKAQRI
jgi:HD-like signal output (HDOD) protein